MKNRSSLMAQQALTCIKSIQADTRKEYKEEYKSRANSFPAMVMQSGLAQATGFFLAKATPGEEDKKDTKQEAYQKYLNDVAQVLQNSNVWDCKDGQNLHEKVITCDTTDYRLLTRDVLQAAIWLRRYCQAFLPKEKQA